MLNIDLMIEVTRKCNMVCTHCLRGDMQNKYLKNSYADTLIKSIADEGIQIDNISFTGGEPSLAVSKIDGVIDSLYRYQIFPDTFFISTNGKRLTPKFWRVIDRLAKTVKFPEESSLQRSNDYYHEPLSNEANYLWDEKTEILRENYGLQAYDTTRGFSKGQYETLPLGYAKDNFYTSREYPKLSMDFSAEEVTPERAMLVLTVDGRILDKCDYEYGDEKHLELGTYQDSPSGMVYRSFARYLMQERLESFEEVAV